MKAITLYQPHATLIVIGAKPYETRSWKTSFRGYLAIHASKSKEDLPICTREPYRGALVDGGITAINTIPTGAVLGVVELLDCIPAETAHDQTFGDFSAGRWAWYVRVVEVFRKPQPVSGQQGLWDWPFDRAALVR